MPHILAIDQSTSATKAVLFDAAGRVVDKASRDHRQVYPLPGWVEHDAEEIWQNVRAVIDEVARRQPAELAAAVGLAITNQRETIVVFDRHTGRPLGNAIVWQCRRGDAICRDLREAGHEDKVRAKSGLKLDTYFSAPKLKWLIRERPEIAARLRDGEALIGTIDAYLIYRLTGGQVFATDPTNASRTLLYDIGRLGWDDELCALFHVPPRALPEVRESFARFGDTDAAGALPKKIPICGVMGDSQASLFAQRCYKPGMAKATFGSGTSVMLNVGDRFSLAPTNGAVSALAWLHNGRPTYALEGIINYSSATVSWLKDRLGLIDDPAETGAIAEAVDDNGGVYFVPAFAGLSAPYWSPDARAAIVGMTAHTGREQIVRAALEAIAYQIRDVLEMMRTSGVDPQRLFVDGGPTRNAFLMQFTADIAGVEIEAAEAPESSALGAALAGLLGLGAVSSLERLAAMPREARIYRPKMSSDKVEQLYAGWQDAVRRVL